MTNHLSVFCKKVFMSQEISDVLFVCEDKNILDALKEEVITSSTRKGVFYFRRLEHLAGETVSIEETLKSSNMPLNIGNYDNIVMMTPCTLYTRYAH